jgi:hypothetical protein
MNNFKNQSFISLETRRKNGAVVPTPVWFAESDGALWVWTQADSGKVKRIRNNAGVRIAPCDQRGGLKGDWVAATASVIDDEADVQRVSDLLREKYGWQKRIFELFGRFRKRAYAAVRISLAQP